jgi:inhibitor of cysteine peptidase
MRHKRMTNRWVLVIAIGLFVMGNACTVVEGQETLIVDESRPQQQVAIREGSTLKVILNGRPGTGYSWQLADFDKSRLQLVERTSRGSGDLPGGVEQQIFAFRAVDSGATSLTFNYQRSWEKNTPPAKTQSVRVLIR